MVSNTIGLLQLPSITLLTPKTLDEAVSLMVENPDAPIIAGGVYIISSIIDRRIRPSKLIDISKLDALRKLEKSGDLVRAGPIIKHWELAERFAPVSRAFKDFGDSYTSPSIANLATLGGSIALRHSSEDLILIMLVHDAVLKLRTASSVREVSLESYLREDSGRHIIEEIAFLNPSKVFSSFQKIALGVSYTPLVSAAVSLGRGDGGGLLCRVATSHCRGGVPGRVRAAEEAVEDGGLDHDNLELVGKTVEKEIDPVDDLTAPAWYRRRVAGVLVRRMLDQLRRALPR
ncbi:Nicotinate dehydrogenase FAD-subunit [archaeon HR01]|nr:Nicotinate dehydrogenase FAD-subunit [archaeon HR01]